MSPRAACRLARLGFDVYDYAAGKVDWMAAGQPTVRAPGGEQRALDALDPDPPTCAPSEPVASAAAAARRHGWSSVLVVDEERVVLGRLTHRQLDESPARPAEQVMEPGPTTVRAHEPLTGLLERMAKRGVDEMPVTTPEGVLLGVVVRSE